MDGKNGRYGSQNIDLSLSHYSWVQPLLQTDQGCTGQPTPMTLNLPGASRRHPMMLVTPHSLVWNFLMSSICNSERVSLIPPAPEVSRGIHLPAPAWMLSAYPPAGYINVFNMFFLISSITNYLYFLV